MCIIKILKNNRSYGYFLKCVETYIYNLYIYILHCLEMCTIIIEVIKYKFKGIWIYQIYKVYKL